MPWNLRGGPPATSPRRSRLIDCRLSWQPADGSIAVIDADYLVEPTWLEYLTPHFANPQIAIVQAVFAPDPERVAWAQRVCAAFAASGGAAVAVNGEMIDVPVVERARAVVHAAIEDYEVQAASERRERRPPPERRRDGRATQGRDHALWGAEPRRNRHRYSTANR